MSASREEELSRLTTLVERVGAVLDNESTGMWMSVAVSVLVSVAMDTGHSEEDVVAGVRTAYREVAETKKRARESLQ